MMKKKKFSSSNHEARHAWKKSSGPDTHGRNPQGKLDLALPNKKGCTAYHKLQNSNFSLKTNKFITDPQRSLSSFSRLII
jgi:hypothetical protein